MDTLGIRLSAPLKEHVIRPSGRTYRWGKIFVLFDSSLKKVERAEGSLPALYFGSNGTLLTTQAEYNEALKKFHNTLAEFCHVPPINEWIPYRIDFSWQFDIPGLPPSAIIIAHHPLLIPGIQNGATWHKGDQGISWIGTRSKFCVTMYDKGRQMRIPGKHVLRVEVSRRDQKLWGALGKANWTDWNVQWRMFHRTVTSIPRIPAPEPAKNVWASIGRLSSDVQEQILASLHQVCPRTMRSHRQKIAASTAGLREEFCWANIISKSRPPEAIHVERRPSQRRSTPHEK